MGAELRHPQLRLALLAFKRTYNEQWMLEKYHYRSRSGARSGWTRQRRCGSKNPGALHVLVGTNTLETDEGSNGALLTTDRAANSPCVNTWSSRFFPAATPSATSSRRRLELVLSD